MRGAFIILSKRLHGFPGLVPVSNHGRRNARPHEDRTAKGDIRIDDHHFGFIGLACTGKEVEFHWRARGIALNTGEIHTQDIPHSKLSILRDIDQLPIFLDRLLLDSRVVDIPMASTPNFVMLSFWNPLFFNSLKNELRCSDNGGA
jgi:hypothetical protein